MNNQIAMQRKQAIKYLMPDICNITPPAANPVVSGAGIITRSAPAPKTWRGVTNIPCRADLSRAFRPAQLKTQTTEVNEFNLELPYDVVVAADDKITLRGRTFIIRKIKDASNWDVTIECVIEEISVQLD